MNNDTSETNIFLIIFVIILYFLLKQFLIEAFIFLWRVPMMSILFPLVYLPDWVTNNGLFFWVRADISEVSRSILNILVLPVDQIANEYVDKGIVSHVNSFVSTLISPYLLPFFVYFFYKNYKFSYNDFKKTHNVDSLIAEQADLWPQIKPFVNQKPQTIDDLSEGKHAMCQSPHEFSLKNDLIITTEDNMGEEMLQLDENKAKDVFLSQFGRPWIGAEDLDQYERYIFAILASRTARDGDLSLKIIHIIGTLMTSETKYSKSEMKEIKKEAENLVEKAIQSYKDNEKVQQAIREHFFVNTVIARLIEEDMARSDGVLATVDFNWFKFYNRTLWYMLNNIGRRVAWTECAGVWYHFNYEKTIKRKIPSPMVSGAVEALDLYYRESATNYIPSKVYNTDFFDGY